MKMKPIYLLIVFAMLQTALFGQQNALVGNITIQRKAVYTGTITPATITANQNNYDPDGFGSAYSLRLATDASRRLSGLASGQPGQHIVISNIGAFNLVLAAEDTGSSAANRFALSDDLTIEPKQGIELQYDGTSSRWRAVGNVSGGAPNTIQIYETIAALKAQSVASFSTGRTVQVLGYYAANDGGDGLFVYNSASSASDNGGTVIAPTAGTGRWLAVLPDGVINVKRFGAKGDGVADDSAAINAALLLAGDIIVPDGTYLVTELRIYSNTNLRATNQNAILKLPLTAGNAAMMRNHDFSPTGTDVKMSFDGIIFDGNNIFNGTLPHGGGTPMINLLSVTDVKITKCTFRNFQYIALALASVHDVVATKNLFHNIGYTGPASGTPIEDNFGPAAWVSVTTGAISSNVRFHHNTFRDCQWHAMSFDAKDSEISYNSITNVREAGLFLPNNAANGEINNTITHNVIDGVTLHSVSAHGIEGGGNEMKFVGNIIKNVEGIGHVSFDCERSQWICNSYIRCGLGGGTSACMALVSISSVGHKNNMVLGNTFDATGIADMQYGLQLGAWSGPIQNLRISGNYFIGTFNTSPIETDGLDSTTVATNNYGAADYNAPYVAPGTSPDFSGGTYTGTSTTFTPSVSYSSVSNDANGTLLTFFKSRAGSSISSNDLVLKLDIQAKDTGGTFRQAAQLSFGAIGVGSGYARGRFTVDTMDAAGVTDTRFRVDDGLALFSVPVQLSALTTNGFLKTSSSNGTLIVDTSNYYRIGDNVTVNGNNVTNAAALSPGADLLSVFTTSAAAVGEGGSLSLGGKTGNAAADYGFARVRGVKASTAGDGNYGGKFVVNATTNAGNSDNVLNILGETGVVQFAKGYTANGVLKTSSSDGTLIVDTTGSAASLSISGQTGLLTFTGITSTNRAKTVRDADDTLLELGGSYTPSGTWNWGTATVTWPTFNQNTTGSAAFLTTGRTIAITGDIAYTSPSFDGSGNVTAVGTLATVNANTGSFGSATASPTYTVNGKGLISAAANVTITPAVGSITGLGTGVATALAVNVGTAGAPVVNGGALGTPSSGTATNLTGTAASLTAGNATKWTTGRTIALTGDVTYTSPSFDGSGNVTAAATLANVPSGVPMAGSLLATAIAAPATPAAGKGSIYVDSTSKNIAVKDDAGVVKHGVQTDTGSSNNFLTAISDSGVISKAQPAFSNLSGSLASAQMPATISTTSIAAAWITDSASLSLGADNLNIFSSSAAAINQGGAITLGGKTGNGAADYGFVRIKGVKASAAGDGNYGGKVAVNATTNAGNSDNVLNILGDTGAVQFAKGYTAGLITSDGSGNLTSAALTGDITTSGSAATLANVPVGATYASDLTASPKNTGGWNSYYVSGSDATTTGQVLATATGLTTGTLSVSTMYEVDAVLYVTTSAVSTGTEYGLTCAGSGTAAVCNIMLTGSLTSATGAVSSVTAIDTADTTAFLTTSSQTGVIMIHGFVTTRGSGTPTISVQHLKVTSGTSTVKIGSVLRVRKTG